MGVLVHGVVEASAVGGVPDRDLEDAAAFPVRWVTAGGLAALVADVPGEEVLPSRSNLLGHLRVLETAAQATVVLPMRFGVVVPDDETLTAEYLVDRETQLLKGLQRLRDRVELRVKVRYVEDEVLREVLAQDPAALRLRGRTDVESKLRLGERIAAGIDRRRQHDAAAILNVLTPLADEVATSEVSAPMDVAAISFLASADGLEAFERAVERLRVRSAPVMTIELAGPLPPFSFTEG